MKLEVKNLEKKFKNFTAVKNINLLPNREGMIKQKKMKAFSNFAYKGVVGAVAGIYLILFGLAFFNIFKYNNELKVPDKHANPILYWLDIWLVLM